MKITEELLKEIEEKAKAATPGPWRKGRDDMDSYHLNGIQFASVYTGPTEAKYDEAAVIRTEVFDCHENAAFISAANPQVILALIERIRDLELSMKLVLENQDKEIISSNDFRIDP